jgi:AcrR family transcriptional regulator
MSPKPIGSVYNEFGDFDGLILTVNRETVQALTARRVAVPRNHPFRQLHGLAETYLAFAGEHANLLRSLFEHLDAFALMHEPLVRLLPDRDSEQVALLARMMFSAVHGIISLGLEERMVAVPPEKLRQQLAHLAGLGIPALA